jgi:3-oxoacyl-[acyl-carrier-protein] synthase III
VNERSGVIATHLTARGQYWSNGGIEARGPRHPRAGGPCEIGPRFYIDPSRGGDVKEFFTWCMASVPDAVSELLRKVSLTIDDVDWVCPHQNVKTVSEAWIDRIGIPRARVVETRKEYGNVGPANVLLNLNRGAQWRLPTRRQDPAPRTGIGHVRRCPAAAVARAWQYSAAATG